MYNVKLLNNIRSTALTVFDSSKYNASDAVENPSAIIVRSAKLHDMEFNPELLCIARAGAGVNNIPLDKCADNGVVVFNTPGANARAVAELAICSLFMASRNIIDGVQWVKSVAGEGDEVLALVEKNKSQYGGPEILGKTLGIIGLGAIGAKIANAAAALGMKVCGYDPYLSPELASKLSDEVNVVKDIKDIYSSSDYISVNVPFVDATRHIINAETIATMKDGVRILNLSRAELVCDDSIIKALDSGKVSCYVTDFPNAKTAAAKGIIPIPHLGASTPESEENCVAMACDEIIDYIDNGNIVNSVNIASATLPRTKCPRVCVIYKSGADISKKLEEAVSSCGAKVENKTHSKGKSHDYSIIDIDVLKPDIASVVGAVEGVVKVRTID
jgi:D-3-phosphoglycerate dehydrogenase